MPIKILYVTATQKEAESLVKIRGMVEGPGGYVFGNLDLSLLITGVGSVSTAWAMKQWIDVNGKPDLAINGGIAGSFNNAIITGDVSMPFSDCFADNGIEDGDNFFTLFEAGLINADEYPYKNGMLYSDPRFNDKYSNIIKPVRAITVNTSTGSETSKIKLVRKFNPDIETMEGATFFYICSMENIPFLALRAISNRVEKRNRDNWNITLALKNLSEKLNDVLLTLQ